MIVLTGKQDLSYFLGYLITLVIIAYKYRKELKNDIKNFKTDVRSHVKKLVFVYIVSISLMYLANFILYKLFGNIASNEESIRELLFKSPCLMSISFGLLGPLIEELGFRYPYKRAKTKKEIKFIIYTLIFASIHIVDDLSYTGILYIIPYTLLSISIGYSFYKTNNIFTSMIAHIFNNVISIITLLIFGG